MNDERVQEIRDRLDAATPGPWGTYKDATLDGAIVWRIGSNATGEDIGTVIHNRDLDAWLVANAPTDLADLLDEREKLLAVVEAAEAVELTRTGPLSSLVAALGLLAEAVRAYRAATTGEAGQ